MIKLDHIAETLRVQPSCLPYLSNVAPTQWMYNEDFTRLERLKVVLHPRVIASEHLPLMALEFALDALILANPWQAEACRAAISRAVQYYIGQPGIDIENARRSVIADKEVEYLAVGAALRGHAYTTVRWMLDPKAVADAGETFERIRAKVLKVLPVFGL